MADEPQDSLQTKRLDGDRSSEGSEKSEPSGKVRLSAADGTQNGGSISSGQKQRLESLLKQVEQSKGASARFHASLTRAMGYPQNSQAWREEIDRLSGKSALQYLPKDVLRIGVGKSELEMLRKALMGQSMGNYIDKLREQMRAIDPYWIALQKDVIASSLFSPIAEKLRGTSSLADFVGRSTSGLWIGQAKGLLSPIGSDSAVVEQMLARVIRSSHGELPFADLLQALQTPTSELKKDVEAVGRKLADEVLIEPTPEGAFRKFVDSLKGLDPLKQFFLIVIFGPLFVGLVLSVVNPVSDHYVKKWLADSPQGAEKQAEARVLGETGGKTVLADYRLVVARHSLSVRESPAASGRRMGSLEFGALVRVVKEDGAFTFVEWRGESDAILSGWVFSRYLKKFK